MYMLTINKKKQAQMTAAYCDFKSGLGLRAKYKVRSEMLCDDLVQNTYFKAIHYLANGGEIVAMKAFLYRTLNNLIIDHYRKKRLISLDMLIDAGFDPGQDESQRRVDVLDGRTAQLLISHLPLQHRQALELRYVEDRTVQEIALATGQSRGATAVTLHRGLAKLKGLYFARS